MMNKLDSRLLSHLMVLLLVLGIVTGCEEEGKNTEKALRPVKAMVVHSSVSSIRNRVFSGTTNAAQEVDLSFRVGGTIKKVAMSVGDHIKRGDIIAQLDTETYRLELQQANASLAQAKANRRNAESEYQRVRQLYTNDNASRNELDTALANAESAIASYNADQQSVRLAHLNLSYTNLKAGNDCTVAEINIDSGENINAGVTAARLNCGDEWEVHIAVPESLIAAFTNGLAGTVQFASLPQQSFTAVVTEVGSTAGGGTTFPVTLELIDVHPSIRSGLAAEVTFQFTNQGTNTSRIYLPAAVVGKDELGTFVYVIKTSDTQGAAVLRRRSVEVGDISELGLEILSGLKSGDHILTAGYSTAHDGMLVQTITEGTQ